ncbi:hypothetical protein ABT039_22635 [Streptomyces lasiicapitis]|uniref:hypothetical protein n=1 Tax=Streptomyces lasiicapitis TaxID=1923961 RepID=UPI0033233A3C
MSTTSEVLAPQPAAADAPPPQTDAVALDFLGRPICEGTTHRATRNCPQIADFKLQRPERETADGYACERHVGQLARTFNEGECGEEYEHRLTPIRMRE